MVKKISAILLCSLFALGIAALSEPDHICFAGRTWQCRYCGTKFYGNKMPTYPGNCVFGPNAGNPHILESAD